MSENQVKTMFLRSLERSLTTAVENIEHNHDAIVDHEVFAKEFEDFANRLYSSLCELRNIRAAIGDMADELGGDPC